MRVNDNSGSALHWHPPEAYPATPHDGGYYLSDWGRVVYGSYDDAKHAVGLWLRDRVANKQLPPFASRTVDSDGEPLYDNLIMIPTDGWDRIEEEDQSD